MCNNQNIAFGVRILQTATVVFLFDIGDERVKAADHIFGRPEKTLLAAVSSAGRHNHIIQKPQNDTHSSICTNHLRTRRITMTTHSPPGHPSVQIFQAPNPFSALCARICLLVNPS